MQFHFSRLIRLLYFILFYSILLFLFTLPKYVVPEKSSRSNVASCVIRNLFPVYNEYVFIVKSVRETLVVVFMNLSYCSLFVFVKS